MAHRTFAAWGELILGAPVPLAGDDFARISGEARGYELVEGRLIWVSLSGSEHGEVQAEVAGILRDFVKPRKLGRIYGAETGFLVSQPGDPDTVLAPDVAYLQASRIPRKGTPERQGFWRVAPDLVVEVASPSQSRPELAEKARLWLQAGVRLVWVLWPQSERVDVYRPGSPPLTASGAEMISGEDVLPGFSCPVADFFLHEP